MYEDLTSWLVEYPGRDNYKLRVYLALLDNKMYAAELARTFEDNEMTVKELIRPGKLADHHFKPLRQQEHIQQVEKKGRQTIYTANTQVLKDIIMKLYENMRKTDELLHQDEEAPPYIKRMREQLKKKHPDLDFEYDEEFAKKYFKPLYDVDEAINVFARLLDRYNLVFNKDLKTITDYLHFTAAHLKSDIGVRINKLDKREKNAHDERFSLWTIEQQIDTILGRMLFTRHIDLKLKPPLQRIGYIIEEEKKDTALEMDISDINLFMRFYVECVVALMERKYDEDLEVLKLLEYSTLLTSPWTSPFPMPKDGWPH